LCLFSKTTPAPVCFVFIHPKCLPREEIEKALPKQKYIIIYVLNRRLDGCVRIQCSVMKLHGTEVLKATLQNFCPLWALDL